MTGNSAARPENLPLLQQRSYFRREGRERRQPTAKTGDDQQPPFRRDCRKRGEKSDGQTNDIRSDQVGGQGSRRKGWKQAVEPCSQLPAQHRAKCGTDGNRHYRFPHRLNPQADSFSGRGSSPAHPFKCHAKGSNRTPDSAFTGSPKNISPPHSTRRSGMTIPRTTSHKKQRFSNATLLHLRTCYV